MSDECALGHAWEVYSGDTLNCINCDITATAVLDDELEGLRRDSNILAALRVMGVDNWEGYDPAMAVTGGGDG